MWGVNQWRGKWQWGGPVSCFRKTSFPSLPAAASRLVHDHIWTYRARWPLIGWRRGSLGCDWSAGWEGHPITESIGLPLRPVAARQSYRAECFYITQFSYTPDHTHKLQVLLGWVAYCEVLSITLRIQWKVLNCIEYHQSLKVIRARLRLYRAKIDFGFNLTRKIGTFYHI